MSENDRYYHFRKRPDRTYVRPQSDSLQSRKMRIVSKVIDGNQEGVIEISRGDQIILRRTPKGRQEIKATIYEDDRSIRTLTLQKFLSKSGPSDHSTSPSSARR